MDSTATRWTMYIALLSASVGIAIMGVLSIYVIIQVTNINKRACEASVDNRTVIRNVLLRAREERLSRATSPEQLREITQLYNGYLALAPRISCDSKGGPIELEP